jgi:hypothetical protein
MQDCHFFDKNMLFQKDFNGFWGGEDKRKVPICDSCKINKKNRRIAMPKI